MTVDIYGGGCDDMKSDNEQLSECSTNVHLFDRIWIRKINTETREKLFLSNNIMCIIVPRTILTFFLVSSHSSVQQR